MELPEALSILQSIHDSKNPEKPEADIHTLGNGELVVKLSDGTFIWNKNQSKQYLRGCLPALKVRIEA